MCTCILVQAPPKAEKEFWPLRVEAMSVSDCRSKFAIQGKTRRPHGKITWGLAEGRGGAMHHKVWAITIRLTPSAGCERLG